MARAEEAVIPGNQRLEDAKHAFSGWLFFQIDRELDGGFVELVKARTAADFGITNELDISPYSLNLYDVRLYAHVCVCVLACACACMHACACVCACARASFACRVPRAACVRMCIGVCMLGVHAGCACWMYMLDLHAVCVRARAAVCALGLRAGCMLSVPAPAPAPAPVPVPVRARACARMSGCAFVRMSVRVWERGLSHVEN